MVLRRVKGFPDPSLSQCKTSGEHMWICVCLLQQQMETSGPCLGWGKYLRPSSPFCSLPLSLALSILSSVFLSLSVFLHLSLPALSPCWSLSTGLQSLGNIACLCVYLFIFMRAFAENIVCFFHQYSFQIFPLFPFCHRCIWQLLPFTEWEGLVGRHPYCGTWQSQRRTVLLHASHRPSSKIHHCV